MPPVPRSLLQCLFTFAAFALASAEPAAGAEGDRVFSVRGIVRAPYQDGTISIQHEAIPDFMPAMTMRFYADAADVKDFAPGDRVEFEFHVGERSRAKHFRRVGRVALAPGGESGAGASAAPMRRLREGDAVPEFILQDQDGKNLTHADLRGRHTILTFVFTRCPVPEFCPLIARKFQSLQDELRNSADDTQLLSISIDPEHDRPAVLRGYGETLGADFGRWRFATGEKEEVERLVRRFAVRVERNGASLDHTLATALVGPDGKVVEIWRGNAWKPAEIVARLRAK